MQELTDLFVIACCYGHCKLLWKLITYEKFVNHLRLYSTRFSTPSIDFVALQCASYQGHRDIVSMLFSLEFLHKPGKHQKGHLRLIKTFFDSVFHEDQKLLSTECINAAFENALSNWRVEVVLLLLELPEIDVVVRDNLAINAATMKGSVRVVKELLKRPNVKADVCSGFPLGHAYNMAAKNGRLRVVKALLKLQGMDISSGNYIVLREACKCGQKVIVGVLLDHFVEHVLLKMGLDKKVDHLSQIAVIAFAAYMGLNELVDFLCDVGNDMYWSDGRLKWQVSDGR
ncbi:hypothetical protein HDU76_003224 [Blyttiomyces sp. JEL0837]|nr:hypothetical protein HDU76_003224 [Blyttiomyces sp. JEL0837]